MCSYSLRSVGIVFMYALWSSVVDDSGQQMKLRKNTLGSLNPFIPLTPNSIIPRFVTIIIMSKIWIFVHLPFVFFISKVSRVCWELRFPGVTPGIRTLGTRTEHWRTGWGKSEQILDCLPKTWTQHTAGWWHCHRGFVLDAFKPAVNSVLARRSVVSNLVTFS